MQTFTDTKIVLMYREKPEETYYNDQHMFVHLDRQSGGYPCRANMLEASDFRTTENAAIYDKKGEFVIAELTIVGTVVVDEEMDSIRTLKVVPKEEHDKELRRQQYLKLKEEFEN